MTKKIAILKNEEIEKLIWSVVDNFLIPKFNELNMKASGEWLRSLEVKVDDFKGSVWGKDYTYYLVNGRANGKRPPINVLVTWVNNKFGIYGKEAESMAYAIGNKIAKEGTNYYPKGTDLLEVLKTKECSDYIEREASFYYRDAVSLMITKKLKDIR